jgi:hypothetical protein
MYAVDVIDDLEQVSSRLTAVDISSWETFTSFDRKIAIAKSVRSVRPMNDQLGLFT